MRVIRDTKRKPKAACAAKQIQSRVVWTLRVRNQNEKGRSNPINVATSSHFYHESLSWRDSPNHSQSGQACAIKTAEQVTSPFFPVSSPHEVRFKRLLSHPPPRQSVTPSPIIATQGVCRLRRKKHLVWSPVTIALAGVALTTFVAIAIAPILVAIGNPWWSQEVQYATYYAMLLAFVALMAVLVHNRVTSPTASSVHVFDHRDANDHTGPGLITVAPCDCQHVWIADQSFAELPLKKQIQKMSQIGLNRLQILVMRDLQIPPSISELWVYLPNLKVLDIQNASVSECFWNGLERTMELEHVLAHGCIHSASMKEILISLPEIKVYTRPMNVVAHG